MSFVRSLVCASVVGLVGAVGCSSSSGGAVADGGAGSSADTCALKCARSNAAHCGDEGTCQTECVQELALTPASCKPQLDALIGCALTATYTCVDMKSSACEGQLRTLNTCIEGAPAIDAGTTPGNTSDAGTGTIDICTADSADDACLACLQTSCCQQLRTCVGTQACFTAFTCSTACLADDEACLSECFASQPAGVTELLQCERASCVTACE